LRIERSLRGGDYVEVRIINSDGDDETIKVADKAKIAQMAGAVEDSKYTVYVYPPFAGFAAGELYLVSVFSDGEEVKEFALIGGLMTYRGIVFYECCGLKDSFSDILGREPWGKSASDVN
jgi:hypothetical protein